MAPSLRKKSELEQLISDIHTYGINYHSRELYLHGAAPMDDVGTEPGVEFRMASGFVKNMHVLDSQRDTNILVHSHTIGGEWNDGMAIFNSIRFARSTVTMLIHTVASSMSGVVLQAADNRVLMPDTDFMIHHGSISFDANSIAAKQMIDVNERLCKRMLQIFARRAIIGPYFKERKWKEGQISRFLDRKIRDKSDWYLPPDEAIYYGFADGILGEKGFENLDKIRTCRKHKANI